MINETEDANETLFYIEDIFANGNKEVNKMLANALLSYAYLPCCVQSLCNLSKKPSISLNTSLYILTQTFKIIKSYSEFTNILFAALFSENLPKAI